MRIHINKNLKQAMCILCKICDENIGSSSASYDMSTHNITDVISIYLTLIILALVGHHCLCVLIINVLQINETLYLIIVLKCQYIFILTNTY